MNSLCLYSDESLYFKKIRDTEIVRNSFNLKDKRHLSTTLHMAPRMIQVIVASPC